MSVAIRAAVPGDETVIARFVRELAEYERALDQVEADAAAFATALFGPNPAAEALIAEDAGKAVGFALFFHNFSTWTGRRGLYLEDLYVTPAARGAGVGRRLLARLAGLAVERGCARMEWVVLDWNEPAIRLYRSIGASAMDEWTTQRLSGEALARLAAG